MATQWATFPVEFKGGVISNLSPLQQGSQAIGSATVLENMEPNRTGGYTKIKGYEKFSSTEVPGTGEILACKVVSSGRVVVGREVDAAAITAVSGLASGDEGKIAYYYGTGGGWTYIAKGSQTSTGKARHATYNFDGDDKTVFVDGNNYPMIYTTNGNTATFKQASDDNMITDVLAAEHVAIYKNTGFYAKGNTVFFTAPYTVDNFSAASGAGSISVGNDITGLAVFREQLIVFTTDSIHKLTGSTAADFRLEPITRKTGCLNGDTIQEVGGDIMYLAPDGIRNLSSTDRIGDFAMDVASDKAYKEAEEVIEATSEFTSLVCRTKAQYRLFGYITSQAVNNARGIVATRFSSQGASDIQWSTTKGIKAFVADSTYTGNTETLMFGNGDGYVYKLDSGNDFDGTDIDSVYESPYMPITDPQMRKTAYKLTLYTEPTGTMDLNFNLLFDFDSGADTRVVQPETIPIGASSTSGAGGFALFGAPGSTFGTATFGGKIKKVYTENLIGSFHTVAMRITDSSSNPPFTLDTAILEYRQNDRQ